MPINGLIQLFIEINNNKSNSSRSQSMSSEMKMRLATDLEINLWHDDVMLSKLAQQATRQDEAQQLLLMHMYV